MFNPVLYSLFCVPIFDVITKPVAVAVVVVAALLIFIIPTFAKMFQDFGGALPTLTQIVIDASHFAASWKGGVVAAVVVALIFFHQQQIRLD